MHRKPPVRRGVTLIELLVVILILGLLTAIAIPVLSPTLRGRQLREAARIVNTFLNAARNRAIQTGRPAGVMFERVPGAGEFCITLAQCESPQPYAGDSVQSRIWIDFSLSPPAMRIGVPGSPVADIGWMSGVVRPGDVLLLNHHRRAWPLGLGEPYTDANLNGYYDAGESYSDANGNSQFDPWTFAVPFGQAIPRFPAEGLPFQIIRQPVRSSKGSVTLPTSTVVDLNFSGDAAFSFHPRRDTSASGAALLDSYLGDPVVPGDLAPVVLAFSPDGSVDRVYRRWYDASIPAQDWHGERPLRPLHILVGERVAVPIEPVLDADSAAEREAKHRQYNWRNPDALWITVNPQSGLITTAANRTVVDPTLPAAFDPNVGLIFARELAVFGETESGQ